MLRQFSLTFYRDEVYTPSNDFPLLIIPIGNFESWNVYISAFPKWPFAIKVLFLSSEKKIITERFYENENLYHISKVDVVGDYAYLVLLPQEARKYKVIIDGITLTRQ